MSQILISNSSGSPKVLTDIFDTSMQPISIPDSTVDIDLVATYDLALVDLANSDDLQAFLDLGAGTGLTATDGNGNVILNTKIESGDAYSLQDVFIDDTAKADQKILKYNSTKDAFEYAEQGGTLTEASGLIDGGVLSVNGGDNTTFDISAGVGQIADVKTTPSTPIITPVTISLATAVAISGGIGSSDFTYILIDNVGVIVQQNTAPTPTQLRTHIYLGKLNHVGPFIASAVNAPSVAIGVSSGLEDLMLEAIGVINATPMVASSGGANLNIDITGGDLWQLGIGYDADKNIPHSKTYAAFDSSVTPFVYVTSDTQISTPTNVLLPASYENPLGTVAVVGSNDWTNQRVYKTLTGNVLVMYGQTSYNSKALALEGLYNEIHITPPILTSGESVLIGIITINENATDTSNSNEVVFQQASKFGEFAKGSAGVATGNLQNAYDNSIEPEILTDDTRGALTLKRGTTGGDSDDVIEVLNAADEQTASINGEGTFDGGFIADSTGVLIGGVLQAGTGGFGVTTLFSITDGSGQVVDDTGKKTKLSWTGLTDLAITHLATNLISFVGINSSGTVIQQTSPFSPTDSRDIVVLGVLVHVNLTVLDAVNNEQHIGYNVMSSLYDAMESIGFFNINGNIFSPNGANLNIDKSQGVMFKMGSNYDTDTNNPHQRPLAALSPATFQYRFSDGSNGVTGTNIDPDNLDDGAGGLTAVGNNQWSIQRIYVFTSNNVKIQRGVDDFATLDAAIAGIATEPYVTEPSIAANGLLRGWLIVKKGATVLNGSDAEFLSAPKFGEGNAGATGAVVDLQEAYDNSSPNPEILTDATGGAFTVRRGSAADTDNIYEGQNGAGTITFSVDGNGNIVTSGTVDGIDIATDVAANTAKVTNANHTGDVTGSAALTIANTVVSNAKLSNVPGLTLKGNNTGSPASPIDMTVAQAQAMLGIVASPPQSINFGPNGLVASAGGSWVFIGDELSWQTDDGNVMQTYFTFVVPADYASGANLQFWSRRSTSAITATVTAWIDNVIDSTINAASIDPVSGTTWELFTLTFGDTVAAGDVINIQIDTDTTGGGVKTHQLKSATFNYSI